MWMQRTFEEQCIQLPFNSIAKVVINFNPNSNKHSFVATLKQSGQSQSFNVFRQVEISRNILINATTKKTTVFSFPASS